MRHDLKIKNHYLEHILEGRKTFEVRKNDRDYQVRDTIRFIVIPEFNTVPSDIHVHVPDYEIVYIHTGLGMLNTGSFSHDSYVVLGIQPIRNVSAEVNFGMCNQNM